MYVCSFLLVVSVSAGKVWFGLNFVQTLRRPAERTPGDCPAFCTILTQGQPVQTCRGPKTYRSLNGTYGTLGIPRVEMIDHARDWTRSHFTSTFT